MRRSRLYGAIAGGLAAAALRAFAARFAAPHPRFADRTPGAVPVDVELVLAVDISYSMDPDEQALQREGYIQALTSREFLSALREGGNGKIAVTYFEWAGAVDQKIVVPWRVIDGPESADAFAAEIARAPYRRASRTSISGALQFRPRAVREQRLSRPAPRHRRVGRRRQQCRPAGGDHARRDDRQGHHHQRPADHAQAQPISATIDIEAARRLLRGLRDRRHRRFRHPDPRALGIRQGDRTKLVLEIAGRQPEARVIPASADKPRISCTIGEKMWQRALGRRHGFQVD